MDAADPVLESVAEIRANLDAIAELPLADAVPQLTELHRQLQAALAQLDRA
jgi:hypothetical protein